MGAGILGLGAGVASLAPTSLETRKSDDPAKIKDAAQQFEALLIGQILRSEREANSGWLGSGSGAGDSATEFAEQHLATALAASGGLGLADLIASGLKK